MDPYMDVCMYLEHCPPLCLDTFPLFRREGNDLIHLVEIDVKESLMGWKRVVKTIDYKPVVISMSNPTPPTWTERFPGLGMTISQKLGETGDFVVGVKIKYPKSLTSEQKKALNKYLSQHNHAVPQIFMLRIFSRWRKSP
jgi:DnaJ-class molecular chaperone